MGRKMRLSESPPATISENQWAPPAMRGREKAMSHELKEGAKVAGITYSGERYLSAAEADIAMSISEQPGQMSMVPWVRIEREDGSVGFANCALLEFVDLVSVEDTES